MSVRIPNAYGQDGVLAVEVEQAAETFGDATVGDAGVEITTMMCETFLAPAGVHQLIGGLQAALVEIGADPDPAGIEAMAQTMSGLNDETWAEGEDAYREMYRSEARDVLTAYRERRAFAADPPEEDDDA